MDYSRVDARNSGGNPQSVQAASTQGQTASWSKAAAAAIFVIGALAYAGSERRIFSGTATPIVCALVVVLGIAKMLTAGPAQRRVSDQQPTDDNAALKAAMQAYNDVKTGKQALPTLFGERFAASPSAPGAGGAPNYWGAANQSGLREADLLQAQQAQVAAGSEKSAQGLHAEAPRRKERRQRFPDAPPLTEQAAIDLFQLHKKR